MHIFWKIKEFRFQFVEWFSENEHVCGYEAVDFCVCVCGGGGGGGPCKVGIIWWSFICILESFLKTLVEIGILLRAS